MNLHFREEINNYYSCNNQDYTDNCRQVRSLLEGHRSNNHNKHYTYSPPDAIGDTNGD